MKFKGKDVCPLCGASTFNSPYRTCKKCTQKAMRKDGFWRKGSGEGN